MDKETLMLEMNRLREELQLARENGLVDYKALSVGIGMNPTYVQQFVTKGSPKILHHHLAEAIRAALSTAKKGGAIVKKRGKVSGNDAHALLERIDIVPEGAGARAYALLKTVWAPDAEKPQQSHSRGQQTPATRPRAKEPS